MGEFFIANSKARKDGFSVYSKKINDENAYVKWSYEIGEKDNTWPMKKTWRMWMSETAKWMAGQGATMPLVIRADGSFHGKRPFNEVDAHELWVRHWLGVDDDGERYKTASGDKGLMLEMMNKHLLWASERGVMLTVPKDGEFQRLNAEQNK